MNVSPASQPPRAKVLRPWMRVVLWIAGVYNLLAGLTMLVFYHEGFKLLGLAKPAFVMPVQLVGVLVGIFGVGYLLVARDPLTNRNILALGAASKTLGPLLACWYIAIGVLPAMFLVVLFWADLVYVPPFLVIWRHLRRVARG